MGTDVTKSADGPEFATKFNDDTKFNAAQRTDLIKKLSPFELVGLMQNAALATFKAEALNIYGDRFGDRHIFILDTATESVVYENEFAFSDIDEFKKYATVVAPKSKSLVMDFNFITLRPPKVAGQPDPDLLDPTRPYIKAKMDKLKDTGLIGQIETIELRRVFGNEYGFLDVHTFPKVVELSLVDSFLYYYSVKDKKVDEKFSYDPKKSFPNVRRLAIARTEFSDFDWIKTHYKKLTHLIADISSETYFNEKEILDAIKANGDLTDFGIFGITPKIMSEIGKSYPKINSLGIKGIKKTEFSKKPETITMGNIKRIYFEDFVEVELNWIKLPNLEEIYWNSEEQADKQLLAILASYPDKLKTLTIEKTVLTDDDLKKIKNLKELEEFTIIFDPTKTISMTGEGLKAFIATCPKLTLVRLVTKNTVFKEDVDKAMRNVAEWEEFVGNPFDTNPVLDDTKAIYTKGSKIVTQEPDKFAFFKNYFYIESKDN